MTAAIPIFRPSPTRRRRIARARHETPRRPGDPTSVDPVAADHRGGRPPIASVVHNPALGRLFEARAGEPARLNGEPIRVSTVSDLASALVLTGFSPRTDAAGAEMELFGLLSAQTN